MRRKPPVRDVDENDVEVDGAAHAAAGPRAVAVAMTRAVEQMGVTRTARTLLRLNQVDGFDCQGCAWPDPDPEHRHHAEFCENGAKAVTEEATLRHLDRKFFATHAMAELADRTDYWLGQQGRLTEPMVLRAGATHYEPIGWDEAFAMVAGHLRGLASPDEAVFYTSGKTSNEAAFAYQLFVRAFGTNNLPDCSNMCHESTSVALAETIGIGKGSVSLEDVHTAELIVILGQNPGTNHPRMLSALEVAKRNGARIIAVNPLREAGLVKFKNPQTPRGWVGSGTPLADLHLPIRLNGDLALFQAIGSLLLQWDAVDRDFVANHTVGFDDWAAHVAEVDWDVVRRATGLTREQVEEAAVMFRESEATILCWAMGITQHRNAVATVKEFVNVALLQGNIGKPGAGLCPVRGHSNVQGDRTMGIWERPKPAFLDALQREFGFDPPREPGFDTVEAVQALRDGRARVFFAMGGNFVSAVSDTDVTEAAMRQADLTVHVSTKLNRSHVVTGREALILPALGRTERDRTGGTEQRVTVEDSMSAVHASKGPLKPASKHLRSEVDIVCGLAEATLGDAHGLPWAAYRSDYGAIRRSIANVVPGCAAYDEKVDQPGGFVLPHPPRDSPGVPHRRGASGLLGQPGRRARGARGPAAAADPALPRPVQHHDLRPRRPLPRGEGRTPGRVRAPRRHRAPRLRRRRPRRPGQRVARRFRAGRDRVPDRRLRPAARVRRGVLPGDQPAGAAGVEGRGQQHPDLEVRRHPAGAAGRPAYRRHPRPRGHSRDRAQTRDGSRSSVMRGTQS